MSLHYPLFEKPYIESIDDEGIDDEELAEKSWENYLLRNRSIIVDMTQGLLRSTLVCLTCGHRSSKFDPYMYLSLPVVSRGFMGSGGKSTLQDCIREFCKPERLVGDSQWHCPKCKAFRDAEKTLALWTVPPILIVHLKRFEYDRRGRRCKITRSAVLNFDLVCNIL